MASSPAKGTDAGTNVTFLMKSGLTRFFLAGSLSILTIYYISYKSRGIIGGLGPPGGGNGGLIGGLPGGGIGGR